MTEVTEQIPHENEDLVKIPVRQCESCNICNLPYIYRSKFEFCKPEPASELPHTYPKPLIFYHHTEDSDYTSQIKQLFDTEHKADNRIVTDYYTDDNAETQYLSSNPVSFLIVGKPEIGQTELAELISENYKCVSISPESVLKEEIVNDTRAGKCIKYNLEAGRSIGPEVILRLVEKRIKSQSVQHRGYVLSGFPMLKNELFQEDPISSESAVFNVQEIFEDLLPRDLLPDKPGSVSLIVESEVSVTTNKDKEDEKSEGTLESEAEIKKSSKSVKYPQKQSEIHLSKDMDLGPSDTTIVTHTEPFHTLKDPNEQLTFLQNLLGQPLVLIYIMCGTTDVRNKREKYRFNVYLQREIFSSPDLEENLQELSTNFSLLTTDTNVNNYPTGVPDLSDYKIDGNTMKMQVKLPVHFKKCISSQLWQYKCHVHSNLKKQIMEHNPQYFMKIDGRLSAAKMFESIQDRLKMLAFQPVLIPEKFTEEEEFGEFGRDIQSPPVEVQTPEIAFNTLRAKNTVGPMYKYQLSNWAFMCPVALKEGRLVQGKTEYAVKFMSKIFFLSSENALIKFYRNPRPYLLPIMPNPTCRIWVMGPRCSGRSVIAKCLSFLFNCKILNPFELETIYMKRKELDFLDKLRTAAISKALAELNNIRKIEHKEQIEEWKKKTLEVLKKASTYKSEVESVKSKKSESMLPEEEIMGEEILGEEEEKLKSDSKIQLEYELKELCLPSLSDSSMISKLLKDSKSLLDHLPEYLKAPVEPATVFDNFVCEKVKDAIQNATVPDMSLSLEEYVEMFKTEIDQAEEEYNLLFQRLGGWIIDGMPLNMELLEHLSPDYLPDDVICLYDEDDDHTFLLSKFSKKDFNSFKGYKQVFDNLKLDSVLDIKYSLVSTTSKIHFIDSVISEVEDRMLTLIDSETTLETRANEKNKAYEEHLNEFKEKWKIINDFITKNKISPLKINVDNKSLPDLLRETVISLENRYRKIATVMTEQDRAQEQIDFAEPISGILGEDFGEGTAEPSVDFFKENRRLGYTDIYCPVTFDRHFVLWKGKEQFSVMFEQQVYLLSSEAAMNDFVINPRLFFKENPPEDFPPARICIIGVPGSGKSNVATKLAENYGLHYINFDDLVLNYLNMPTNDDFEQVLRLDPTMNPTYFNHLEDIEIIKNYVENDIQFSDDMVKIILSNLWFEDIYKNVGFVLDNFPRRPSDIPIMIENFLIPDIVIELHVSQEIGSTRTMPNKLNVYRYEINEKRRLKDLENEKIYNKWYEERIERLQILAEEKRQLRKIQAVEQSIQNRKLAPTPVESGVSLGKIEEELEGEALFAEEEDEDWFVYDEILEMEDLDEINKLLDEETPEPIFNDVWETEEETQQRILSNYDSDYDREISFIDVIRNGLKEENIDCAIVDTDNFIFEKVLYEVIRLVDQFKYRNKSLFERVYEITLDDAERLLLNGYYFISKFGRTCPVQIYENINPIQMFLPGETKMNIFTLIFKRYIYFLYGEESRDKFKNDPIKYVLNNDYKFPLIPFRIAILGPPKSGKTTLAKRFEKEFQMKLISRGSAIRYMQEKLPNSELTKTINFILQKGWSATFEMVAKAVETLTMHSRSLSQGYILDGFPCTPQEMNQYKYIGIVPHLIIDIQTSINKIKEHAEINFHRDPFPTYSFEYIKHFYEEWKKNAQHFRHYIYKEYQNIQNVENLDSKWHLWDQAKEKTFSIMKEYQLYIKDKEFDKVLLVKSLCVTPSEFFKLQSVFLNYCPLCYYYDNYLLQSDPSPDRNCVVQYLGEYFYICEKHQEQFIASPQKYIPPVNENLLPEDLPRLGISNVIKSFHEDGLCIVSFWDNQPKYVLLKGDINYAVYYKGVNYLFCSEYCMKKFMATPYVYYNKLIHFKTTNLVEIGELNKLPTLGYLEQLAARILIDAVIDVEIQRPYFVGLTIPKSAAIQIAIYLKRNNPKTPKLIVPLYDEAKGRLDERRSKFKSYLGYFKGRLNPYVHYEPRHLPKLEQLRPDEEIKCIELDIKKWLCATRPVPVPEYCEG